MPMVSIRLKTGRGPGEPTELLPVEFGFYVVQFKLARRCATGIKVAIRKDSQSDSLESL